MQSAKGTRRASLAYHGKNVNYKHPVMTEDEGNQAIVV